jgi:hypothetical protein
LRTEINQIRDILEEIKILMVDKYEIA